MLQPRELLAYLAIENEGDYQKIFDDIKNKVFKNEADALSALSQLKCHYLTIIDEDYPDYLKRIPCPPIVLFYYGDISLLKDERKNISVVGSRIHSSYGEESAKQLVKELSSDYHIVSGMALGIDAIAHKTAINNHGKTIAVLPSGIDYCYPFINKDIYEEIKKNHLLISEHPCKYVPKETDFVFRNRIITALSKGLLVIEAGIKSGTMASVHHALNQGRDVMCIPYNIDEASGNNLLIKEGAFLVQNKKDIDEVYGKIEN